MEKMEESTEATVPEEMELLDFPDEVLLNITIHLNDTTLLNMTRVCKRFKAIAKRAFTTKYNGTNESKYFEVRVFQENLIVERKQYQPFFSTFGEHMIAIEIRFSEGNAARDHWIFAMIRRFCTNLSKMAIEEGDGLDLLKMFQSFPKPSLTHLRLTNIVPPNTNWWSEYRHPNLIHLCVDDLYEFEQQDIVDFINTNTQLEEIHLTYVEDDDYVPFLGAIENNCREIRKLKIKTRNKRLLLSSEIVGILCKLSTLNWLEINAYGLKLSQLDSLVRQLPNLSTLRLNHTAATSEIYENLTRAISTCQSIPKLTIQTIDPDFPELSNDLLAHIADKIMLENKMVVLKGHKDVIVIVKGEVQRNKIIVYKHDATDGNQPETNFLDLNNTCLAKIMDFLKPKHHCALYDTCQRTRKAIKDYYSEEFFYARFTSKELNESYLWCLGKEVQSMALGQQCLPTRNDYDELWRRINQYCINLIRLTIYVLDEFCMIPPDCVWPKLKELIFSAGKNCFDRTPSVRYETLRSFSCPSLTHLEVICLQIVGDILDHGDHFRHLTVLKFGCYNESVKKFLLALDDNVCEQMQELSIGSQLIMSKSDADDEPIRNIAELVSVVPRFRKLTTLQLIVAGVDRCNTKYLFENCTKLVHFGVWCQVPQLLSDDLFKHILDNCLHIGTIRLFGHGIYRSLLQKFRKMFPNVSVEVAVQDNVAFKVTDEHPSYKDLGMNMPELYY